MRLSSIRLQRMKSFADSGQLELSSKVNLFVGRNNTGKSTFLRCAYLMQDGLSARFDDIRVGSLSGEISVGLAEMDEGYVLPIDRGSFRAYGGGYEPILTTELRRDGTFQMSISAPGGPSTGVGRVSSIEPKNLFYPFLSSRRVAAFTEDVSSNQTRQVYPDLRNLNARVDMLASQYHPKHQAYDQACRSIINLAVGAADSPGGKKAGIYVDSTTSIPIEAQGDGIPNLLGLITSLCIAENQVFLIEEPENDVHPEALRGLLDLILESSVSNQFLISTHSNVVLQHLAAREETQVFEVVMEMEGRVPTSRVAQIPKDDPRSRQQLLANLGYQTFDFDTWQGWLFMEEASGESVVKELLVPKFYPGLQGRLRTVSTRGADRIGQMVEDFHSLFVFVHLSEVYRDKAWVVADGDEKGVAAVAGLKDRFSEGWSEDRFRTFSQPAFERFYPPRFHDEVEAALGIVDRKARQEAKGDLAKSVITWGREASDEAVPELRDSAAEVLSLLAEIELAL